MPYILSPLPSPFFLLPSPLSLLPYPLSLIPYPLSIIPSSLSPLPFYISLISFVLSQLSTAHTLLFTCTCGQQIFPISIEKDKFWGTICAEVTCDPNKSFEQAVLVEFFSPLPSLLSISLSSFLSLLCALHLFRILYFV